LQQGGGLDDSSETRTLMPRFLRTDDLPIVEPWFDDPETQRWLGDREWPRRLLRLAREPHRFALLYAVADHPAGLLDIELYEEGTAAVAVVVSPKHRGRGLATSILRSVFDLPQTEGMKEVIGEVESENEAGERCVRAAGFTRLNARSEEGFLRFALRRGSE
jgi:RimJ/RimL family protein N-acetyltransferase